MMVKILLENITKIFEGNVEAVKDFTLNITDKEITSLLGPSGCGKTTLMRIISGLETPTKGRVYFDEQDVTDVSARDRNIAMVFQFPVVYPTMSVFDNIAYPLRLRKEPKETATSRVKEIARTFGLTEVLDYGPSSLDLATKQKVALARTLVRKPSAYLLDEPLTNLDPAVRVEMRTILKRITTELNQTLVYVTHDQAEALTLSDKIAVMRSGELVQFGTPDVVYRDSADKFVGWFLGNPGMNFIDGTLKEGREGAFIETSGFRYDVTDLVRRMTTRPEGVEVSIGARPEYVEVSKDKKGGEWIRCKCSLVEPLGSRNLLFLEVGGQTFTAKTSMDLAVAEGESVWFNLPLQRIHIYDNKTGKMIA
jgi:ABC-type sugar transport system ATPase subunit